MEESCWASQNLTKVVALYKKKKKFKIFIKFYKNLDNVIFGEGYDIRECIVLLRYFANGEVIESYVMS